MKIAGDGQLVCSVHEAGSPGLHAFFSLKDVSFLILVELDPFFQAGLWKVEPLFPGTNFSVKYGHPRASYLCDDSILTPISKALDTFTDAMEGNIISRCPIQQYLAFKLSLTE